MSRIYDALRQSAMDKGVVPPSSGPNSFLPMIVPETDAVAKARTTVLEWEQIPSLSLTLTPESRVACLDNGLAAEKFNLLSARLRHLQQLKQLKRLVITSAVPEEGKTLVAINLAVSLAMPKHQKILLLEGDLHRPAVAQRLGLSNWEGLSRWWANPDLSISRALCRVGELQLWLLTAGKAHAHPMAVLQSVRFTELIVSVTDAFDWIIIDAPTLLPLADAAYWVQHADGTLLVLRERTTSRKLLQKGMDTLDNPRLVGIVVNEVDAVKHHHYNQYHR